MNLVGLVFYHPKNPQNLQDMAMLAAALRLPLCVVRRPGATYNLTLPPRSSVNYVDAIEAVADCLGTGSNAAYIVLETYGRKYLTEVDATGPMVLVLGAEDYGVPPEEAAKLPGRVEVAKIPVAVQGMSYNVVVTAAMALYELRRPRGGTP